MPQTLPILEPLAKGGFRLMEANLRQIVNADAVRDKPVVLVSVAGAFRKGKSFLLDMMLRYLRRGGADDWLEGEQDAGGFPWQSGYRRHTTGILLWSQGLPVTLPSGEEVVVLLMDTQGTFDHNTSVQESSMVFALSTLLSSCQVYNLQGNIQADDLQHLQLFTEYGRLALADQQQGDTPFQRLMFLVRDWQFADDLPYGTGGGQQLVDEWLRTGNTSSAGSKELERVRQHVRDCFREIGGFLLPHPGKTVASGKQFGGDVKDMTPEFAAGLRQLMPLLLSPQRLEVKTIGGNRLLGRDVFGFIETYVTLFKSDQLPKPKSILAATAEANNMSAMQDARALYIAQMERLLGEDKPSLSSQELTALHTKTSREAEQAFRGRKKMGDRAMADAYLAKLQMETETWFKMAESANNVKRQKERLMAEKTNRDLVPSCHDIYVEGMQEVAGEDSEHVSLQALQQAHDNAKQTALTAFEDECVEFEGTAEQARALLKDDIESTYKQLVYNNDVKKDAKNYQAAAANMKAVSQAKKSYQSMMDTMTVNQVLGDDELQDRHAKAKESAAEVFDSMKDGDEVVYTGYLEAMLSDLDRSMETYIKANRHRVEMKDMENKISHLKSEVAEAKQASNRRRCIIQ